MNKEELRTQYIKLRANIEGREKKQAAMLFNIFGLKLNRPLVYLSIGNEADTKALIKIMFSRGDLFVPFTQNKIITPRRLLTLDYPPPDKYGNIPLEFLGGAGEPLCSVTPLICFDKALNRIGYGAGCYDNFFMQHPKIIKIGLAFDEQLTDAIIPDAHDVKLDYVITEAKTYKRGTK